MTIRKYCKRFWESYWSTRKKVENWWNFQRKNMRRLLWWICGWFLKEKPDTGLLTTADSIVVCAHPDDETLYFYSVLKEKKPFIICMSGIGSNIRRKEFCKALETQGVQGMMLNLPDVPHMVWVWKWFGANALRKVAKKCTSAYQVYTHSSSGESHHPHHYATNTAVEKAFMGRKIITTAAEPPGSGVGELLRDDLEKKQEILRACYPSQIKMLENWYPCWDTYLKTEYFVE